MRTSPFINYKVLIIFLSITFSVTMKAQVGGWKPQLEKDSKEALHKLLKSNQKLRIFYDKAYGYAIFPKVTKAGIGIGGAAGRGIVYKSHKTIGIASLKQASFGLQLGGQQYIEIIFFENRMAFEHFKNGNLKFDAQASAVALTEGASIDMAYFKGVAVFTKTLGGLMYEATIGGQHFKFKPKY
jgi:lipid-binding SYLF domain-containing protein